MKLQYSSVFLLLGAALAAHDGVAALEGMSKDRVITKVVKMLKAMVEKSEKEGEEDHKIFGKFKCYCDTSTAEKRASLKDLEKEISLLEAKIEQTMGESGELSSASGDLTAKIDENVAAVRSATAVHEKEQKALTAEKKDLEGAIEQMSSAIAQLGAVGADQTAGSGADHKKFMAGHKGASLLTVDALNPQISQALTVATAFMSHREKETTSSFLQAPFTGSYTSQSTAVMGILKNMRDTFKANLAEAKQKLEKGATEHAKYEKIKKTAKEEMTATLNEKQKELGENDSTLSTKRAQLLQAQKKVADEQEFLDKLLPRCQEKAKQFETRTTLRANEEAAISEAVSLLSSDAAFDLLSTGKSTSSFIQLSTKHHRIHSDEHARKMARKVLLQASEASKSVGLANVAALLQTSDGKGWVVTQEIEKMRDVIKKEGAADTKKHEWCKSERKENGATLKKKKKEILLTTEQTDKLTTLIKDPETGILAQIAKTENTLEDNIGAQASQTKLRVEQNVAYQKNVKNLVASESLLKRALKALSRYYDDLEEKIKAGEAGAASLLQLHEAPDTPGTYKGQSKAGGAAIEMMEFIIKETQKELAETHDTERKGQFDFEDAMAALKKSQAENENSLANLRQTLATKEQELLAAQEDLKATTKDKDAVVDYLAKIKAGCDFITENYALRVENRKTEDEALQKALNLLKGTPAYKKFSR